MYIGADKIKKSEQVGDLMHVEFESGIVAKYPKEMYDAMVTAEVSDDSQLRDRRLMKALQEYVGIVLKFDLTFGEIEALNLYTLNFLTEKKNAAMAKILRPHMRNPFPESLHPSRTINAFSLGDVDRVLEDKSDAVKH